MKLCDCRVDIRPTLLSPYVPGLCVAPRLQSCDLFDRHFITYVMSSPTAAPIQPPAQTPKVYRAMKRNPADDLPVVGSTSSSDPGARPGIDITVDTAGNVVLDVSGMSVAPSWRDLDFTRIPKRLRHIVPGATGANSTSCFTMGTGPFQNGVVANGLESIPDLGRAPVTHGVIAPIQVVALAQYQTDLENTRAAWQIDET